jgi:ParB family chromosome partitioning protein
LDPIEEALAFKRYVEEYGYGSVTELARRIGKSHSYVSRRIALLSLPDDVREELLRRRKSSSIAQELVKLEADKARELTQVIVEKGLKRKEVRKIVKRIKEHEEDPPYPWQTYSNTEMEGRRMERALNKCIAALKTCLYRLNEIIENVEDWTVKETLWQCREGLNKQIDNLIKLKKKVNKH